MINLNSKDKNQELYLRFSEIKYFIWLNFNKIKYLTRALVLWYNLANFRIFVVFSVLLFLLEFSLLIRWWSIFSQQPGFEGSELLFTILATPISCIALFSTTTLLCYIAEIIYLRMSIFQRILSFPFRMEVESEKILAVIDEKTNQLEVFGRLFEVKKFNWGETIDELGPYSLIEINSDIKNENNQENYNTSIFVKLETSSISEKIKKIEANNKNFKFQHKKNRPLLLMLTLIWIAFSIWKIFFSFSFSASSYSSYYLNRMTSKIEQMASGENEMASIVNKMASIINHFYL